LTQAKDVEAWMIVLDRVTFGAALLAVLAVSTPAVAGAQGAVPDSRVEKLLQGATLTYYIDEDGDFRLTYDLTDGRSQVAWVASRTSRLQTVEIRDVWSVAYRSIGQVPADVANQLLLENAAQTLGAWQIQRSGDEYLIVFSAQVAADTDVPTLVETIDAVIHAADGFELRLTGGDRF
jgi:hypothetical protein